MRPGPSARNSAAKRRQTHSQRSPPGEVRRALGPTSATRCVMPGLGPGIHDFAWAGGASSKALSVRPTHSCRHPKAAAAARKAWMAGPSPAMAAAGGQRSMRFAGATISRKKSLKSIPIDGHLPPLPSGEEPRAHRVMQAEGRRSRGGRSVASDSGGRRDCRAVPKGSVRRRTGKPENIRPPATTSRARP